MANNDLLSITVPIITAILGAVLRPSFDMFFKKGKVSVLNKAAVLLWSNYDADGKRVSPNQGQTSGISELELNVVFKNDSGDPVVVSDVQVHLYVDGDRYDSKDKIKEILPVVNIPAKASTQLEFNGKYEPRAPYYIISPEDIKVVLCYRYNDQLKTAAFDTSEYKMREKRMITFNAS